MGLLVERLSVRACSETGSYPGRFMTPGLLIGVGLNTLNNNTNLTWSPEWSGGEAREGPAYLCHGEKTLPADHEECGG